MTTMADTISSERIKTALAFVNAFSTFCEAAMLSVRTPSCIQYFAPHSVNISPKTNSNFKGHFAKLGGVMSSFPFTVKEMIDNTVANQVSIWTTASLVWLPEVIESVGKGETKGTESGEVTDWACTGEYMFLLSFEDGESGEDGEGGKFKRIERIVEFVDSKGTARLQALMQKTRDILGKSKQEWMSPLDR
jgi:hypothetical protein